MEELTEICPVLKLGGNVTTIELLVVDSILFNEPSITAPVGAVQLYSDALATAAIEYTLIELPHTLTA